MNYCPDCGAEVPDGAEYCAGCGEQLGSVAEGGPRSAAVPGDGRVVPKQEASVGGIAVGVLGSLGIILAHFLSGNGGFVNTVSLILTVLALVLAVSLLDDYFEFGVLGSWEPRKARLIGVVGGLGLVLSLLVFLSGKSAEYQVGSAAILRLLSSILLVSFSGAVGLWQFGFRKKMGAK